MLRYFGVEIVDLEVWNREVLPYSEIQPHIGREFGTGTVENEAPSWTKNLLVEIGEVEVDVFANVEGSKAKKIKMLMTIKTNKTTTAVEKRKVQITMESEKSKQGRRI